MGYGVIMSLIALEVSSLRGHSYYLNMVSGEAGVSKLPVKSGKGRIGTKCELK